MTTRDTIVAVASPMGRGAIGVIRVSGPHVPQVALALLGTLPQPRCAELRRFRDAFGHSLDEGLALYFPEPASFTGEHVLELQGHGGMVVLDLVVGRLVELGCRPALPGEFSERAFLAGKIDVAQAEAVADLIDAGSQAAARAAMRSLQGDFSARVHGLQSLLTDLRVHVEAAIDFPDEEIDFLEDAALGERLARMFDAFDALGQAAEQGALLREGYTVVIAGRPNAGKSSLLNRLIGDDVAIVTDTPGTTRDLLRHDLQLEGLPLKLIDTAGLRPAADPIEAEGVRRAQRAMARADRVLYLVDVGAGPATAPAALAQAALAPQLDELPPGVPVTLVCNKIDLAGIPAGAVQGATPQIFLSAKSGDGVGLLKAHLQASAGYLGAHAGALSARRRHLDALGRAHAHALQAEATLRATRAAELFAEELRCAQLALGEITGEFTSDDLLGEIFRGFCIGK